MYVSCAAHMDHSKCGIYIWVFLVWYWVIFCFCLVWGFLGFFGVGVGEGV